MALAILLEATCDGRAFTTEARRRLQVAHAPQPIPNLRLRTGEGQVVGLRDFVERDQRAVIIAFVYLHCRTLCSTQATVYQGLQDDIVRRGLEDRVVLLSISFDPSHDDVEALNSYAKRLGADPKVWRIVSLASREDRQQLLDAFGIVVIPAPLGEFQHNAALHVIDRQGRLARIIDPNAGSLALDSATGAQR